MRRVAYKSVISTFTSSDFTECIIPVVGKCINAFYQSLSSMYYNFLEKLYEK